MEIADIMAKAFPAKKTVRVSVRGDLIELIEEATDRWQAAIASDGDVLAGAQAPALYDELQALVAEAEAEKVPFTVTSIGSAWGKLVREYPPTEADMLDGWKWNMEEFPAAALAACCVDPVMTIGEADALIEVLRDGELERLYGAVLALNIAGDLVPKLGRGTEPTQRSEPTSDTAPLAGSPTPSS